MLYTITIANYATLEMVTTPPMGEEEAVALVHRLEYAMDGQEVKTEIFMNEYFLGNLA